MAAEHLFTLEDYADRASLHEAVVMCLGELKIERSARFKRSDDSDDYVITVYRLDLDHYEYIGAHGYEPSEPVTHELLAARLTDWLTSPRG